MAIIGVLVGIAIGLRFNVAVLISAIALAVMFALIFGARGDGFWSLVLTMVTAGMAIKLGYFVGIFLAQRIQ